MSDRKAIRSRARQIAANVLKVCEKAIMRRRIVYHICTIITLQRERERERERERGERERERESKLTCVSTRTLSRIKAEPEKEILVPKKPRIYMTEPDDFDKCVVRRTVR